MLVDIAAGLALAGVLILVTGGLGLLALLLVPILIVSIFAPALWRRVVQLRTPVVVAIVGIAVGIVVAVVVGTAVAATTPRHAPHRTSRPTLRLLGTVPRLGRLAPIVSFGGDDVAWAAFFVYGTTVVKFDQRFATLHLHSGSKDAGFGYRWGDEVAGSERSALVAAFNGGFALNYGRQGFESYGRVGVPLQRGLASIVTYANGTTDIGNWGSEVPARHQQILSVRQNLSLLLDHGRISPDIDCIQQCWGFTLGGVPAVARSALGITAAGALIWAGGMKLTPLELAQTLRDAGAVRAVELDINPEWVAFDLYSHQAIPLIAGHQGIPGQFLAPYSRDFFTVEAHQAAPVKKKPVKKKPKKKKPVKKAPGKTYSIKPSG